MSTLRSILGVAIGLSCAACAPAQSAEPGLPAGFEFVANRFDSPSSDARDSGARARPPRGDCDGGGTEAVRISCDGEQIVSSEPLGFHPGRSIPPEPARSALDRVAALMKQRDDILLVRVEAYGSRAVGASPSARRAEIEQSQSRADAVLMYLWRRGGISAERLEAVGYGHDPRFRGSRERWPIVLRILQRREEFP